MKKSGFALVELLVVIAIYAIIWELLSPVLRRQYEPPSVATSRFVSGTCRDHAKQVAFALAMYTQDYDETTPATAQPNPLRPYVKSSSVFVCECWPHGYAMDSRLAGRAVNDFDQRTTVALIECNLATGQFDPGRHVGMTSIIEVPGVKYRPDSPSGVVPSWHPCSNVGYLDGHVDFRATEEVENMIQGATPFPLGDR